MSNVIICPVCGFSFQFDMKTRIPKIKCPMCGHEFGDPNLFPFLPKE
ncbi:MAG: hypothetical protein HWN81_23725 [Candidatus Lokiarchaeota archaeon]|nr:hypothetical protein [Candidatus Lokiarchaeota archaeon]